MCIVDNFNFRFVNAMRSAAALLSTTVVRSLCITKISQACHIRSLITAPPTFRLNQLPSCLAVRALSVPTCTYHSTITHSKPTSRTSPLLFSNKVIDAYSRLSSSSSKVPDEDDDKLTVFQRFKKVYKEHGKMLIAVHVTTSIVWYGCFFLIAKR